jgi:hypothetical protein
MRINEIITEDDGGTIAGNIASVTAPLGGTIKRMDNTTASWLSPAAKKKSKSKKRTVSENAFDVFDYSGTRPDRGTEVITHPTLPVTHQYPRLKLKFRVPKTDAEMLSYREFVRQNRKAIMHKIKKNVPYSEYFLPTLQAWGEYKDGGTIDVNLWKMPF